ncbi:MAG: lipopolysaccharide kinase InaA family protein [Gemmatimonadota bacterium]
MTQGAATPGYERLEAGRCVVVVRSDLVADARVLLAEGTLYEAAARDLGARVLHGRGPVYSIALPVSGTRAVVRRNRHGGLFAPITRDLFLPPTRAPRELAIANRLIAAGVRTPPVLMYGVVSVGGIARRADVVTQEIGDSRDLATYMMPGESSASRSAAWSAARTLLAGLAKAGVRHPDLNVKNILITAGDSVPHAWVLDVDVVQFGTPGDEQLVRANTARLSRSARKWRDERGAVFDGGELEEFSRVSCDAATRVEY